ncbi:MAG: protein-tyrosine-phosphatase [Candidatus Parabeggiatoa sp. nov. 3]|nr:MAG: protein-tyrosine-phosphatase [Gammaproteobacteria bacterium]RKZ63822.1 MAG: protein-tyrosine-phosphatase [Gammaproteobacteria bacterium]HEW97666.1 protein-tyrosine-phosphatase [Beggiatoa sp.]
MHSNCSFIVRSNMKQSLDYTNPKQVVNFRDVGDFIKLISGIPIMPIKRLYRGGTIKYFSDISVIENPKTIFCLQKGHDPVMRGIRNVHFPILNDYEKYETETPEVRKWLRRIVGTIESGIEYPLYVHCLSGRDRTGVVIAALLRIIGVKEEEIIEEYNLSTGTEQMDYIYTALEGLRHLEFYFHGIDLQVVKGSLLG